MSPNRIVYSRSYLKRFQPADLLVSNKLKKKLHGEWQRAVKCTPMHLMTVPVIVSTNYRSLTNKMNYLYSLLYSNVYCNTGEITLQETCLHDSYDDNLISLSGFTVYRQDRCSSEKKRGGGVANNVCFKFSNDNIDCITV
ncbi:unnamed protein product [Trichobilharzia regenti]|nr:unnamed protein product [Trichobilharzia regenti]